MCKKLPQSQVWLLCFFVFSPFGLAFSMVNGTGVTKLPSPPHGGRQYVVLMWQYSGGSHVIVCCVISYPLQKTSPDFLTWCVASRLYRHVIPKCSSFYRESATQCNLVSPNISLGIHCFVSYSWGILCEASSVHALIWIVLLDNLAKLLPPLTVRHNATYMKTITLFRV